MNHKRLKNYLKFGFLLIFMNITIIGCQQDDFQRNELSLENEKPFSMRIISNDEINNNKVVSEQLLKFSSLNYSDGFQQKDIYNSEYDFTVNTDYSKYIESNDGSLHSYTFIIESEEDNGLLENLVLTLQPDGTYQAEIVVYEFLDENSIEIKTAPLEHFDSSQYLGKFSFSFTCTTTLTCISWTTYCVDCDADNPVYSTECVAYSASSSCSYTYYTVPHLTENGGGGVNTGWNNTVWTGSSGGGGSSSGSGNNNSSIGSTIATSPFIQSQIYKLTKQTKNNQIKSRIQQMEGDLDTAIKEQGSEFRRLSTSDLEIGTNIYSEHQIPIIDTGFDFVKFQNAVSNSEVRVHMHHNSTSPEGAKLAPVFSIDDIFGMSEFYKQKSDSNAGISSFGDTNISSILVSRRGLYAMRVDDASKVIEFHEFLTNGATNSKGRTYQGVLQKGFESNVINKTIQQCGNCNDAQEEVLFELNFINFFKQLDTGLSLFVSYEKDDNGNYIWTFLTN